MSEIEAKRKELQDNSKNNKLSGMNVNPHKFVLEGFNLGVEMARKEIFKKLDDKILYLKHLKNELSKALIFFLKDFKQSLEEKK